MKTRAATAALLVLATLACDAAHAQPRFGGRGGDARFGREFGGRGFRGAGGFDRPGWRGGPYVGFRGVGPVYGRGYAGWDWRREGGWRYPPYAAVFGGAVAVAALRAFVPPPAYFAPPPIYFAPPPIVLGLPPVAPAPILASAPPPPAFDPGPLLGAAVAPPVVILPPPALVAEAGPPPIIPTPLESALPITPPAVADGPIPASWRVDGYITAAYVRPVVARRVVHIVPVVRYVEEPPPVVVFAEPPPYIGPPFYGRHWHRGWGGPWRHDGWRP